MSESKPSSTDERLLVLEARDGERRDARDGLEHLRLRLRTNIGDGRGSGFLLLGLLRSDEVREVHRLRGGVTVAVRAVDVRRLRLHHDRHRDGLLHDGGADRARRRGLHRRHLRHGLHQLRGLTVGERRNRVRLRLQNLGLALEQLHLLLEEGDEVVHWDST